MPLLPLLGLLAACGLVSSGPPKLESSSSLEPGCYDSFTPEDHANVTTKLQAGDGAIDFELKTVKGKPVHLSELLLEGKPVALITASATCDRYRKREAGLSRYAKDFDGRVHTVVVYTTEAHPKKDPSPYRGSPWTKEFSDRGEADEWIERAKNASDLKLPSAANVVVDEMDNPVWCSYGPCPNCAFLIHPDGSVDTVQKWFEPKALGKSTKALLDTLGSDGD